MQRKSDINEYLLKLYTDPNKNASFGGINRLYEYVKQDGKYKISRKDIKDWLSGIDAYTLHKPARRNYKRNVYLVDSIDSLWQLDLIELQTLSKQNKGIRYLLTCIDIFSKFAQVMPLKTKSGPEVAKAIEKIFSKGRVPQKVNFDKGREWLNKHVSEVFKKHKIHSFTTQDDTVKASVVERFNKTFKSRLFRYLSHKNTHKYHDVLQALVKSYNNSYHRSIKCAPAEVTKENESLVWKNLYGKLNDERKKRIKNTLKRIKKRPSQFKPGDKVRISIHKYPFMKSYKQQWSLEVFVVVKCIKRDQRVFLLRDLNGEDITGKFYAHELQKVRQDDDALYKVEKVIRKRRRNGVKEYFVKFLGYPSSHNAWVTYLTGIE